MYIPSGGAFTQKTSMVARWFKKIEGTKTTET
jgi:hypothetical protein